MPQLVIRTDTDIWSRIGIIEGVLIVPFWEKKAVVIQIWETAE
jgi:hypothetical protein